MIKIMREWWWYLYGPSVGQWSGQSSLVWFCRMLTISRLTDWISLSAPGHRQTEVREAVQYRRGEGSVGPGRRSLTPVGRPSLRLGTVSVEILRGERRGTE